MFKHVQLSAYLLTYRTQLKRDVTDKMIRGYDGTPTTLGELHVTMLCSQCILHGFKKAQKKTISK